MNSPTIAVSSSAAEDTAARPLPRTIRIGAASLIAGGIVGILIHVLYGIGHGRTVFNENKEVLGLTNDTWSRVGVIGTALLVIGLVVLRRTDSSRPMRRATTVLIVGLVLRSAADWIFNLYVPAELLLIVGRAMLVVALVSGAVLPRWCAVPMVVTVACWVLFAAFNDAVYDAATQVAGYTVAGNDVLAFVTALAWVCLGAGMHMAAEPQGRWPPSRSSGADHMSTITLIHEAVIDAPAAMAWRVVADYSRDVDWRRGVVRMAPTPVGLVQVGTTTAEEMKLAGTTYRNNGQVVAVDPGSRFQWCTTAGAVAHGSRQVTPIDSERCRVRLELHVTPTGPNRLFAPILRRMLDKGLAGDVQRLRELVETATPRNVEDRSPSRPPAQAAENPERGQVRSENQPSGARSFPMRGTYWSKKTLAISSRRLRTPALSKIDLR